VSEDDEEADNESDVVLDHGTEDPQSPEQQGVSTTPNIAGVIWPILRIKKTAEKGYVDR
jgi:hypothetical protein